MEALDYIKLANSHKDSGPEAGNNVSIRLISNFTDDLLGKLLKGKSLSAGLTPQISLTPYRQYHLLLKNKSSELFSSQPDISFVFFDLSAYKTNEFSEPGQFEEILQDLKHYAAAQKGPVIINSFILPYHSAYGNLISHNRLLTLAEGYNLQLKNLSSEVNNIHIFDTNRLVSLVGEKQARDLRSHYAFDLPFSLDFFKLLAEEWFIYVLAAAGRTKKCIVLDLDNTLWGGVVGESGALGILLGPDYPGLAFQNFQRALLEYHGRGVLLAINSKNNPADVEEVFKTNPHMVLRPEHFAAVRTNWNSKPQNLLEIAKELNIGLDSMVFLDDDPVNREMVRLQTPEVLVPEFSLQPENYTQTLFSLPVFNPFPPTDEDKNKGQMYQQEKQRKKVMASSGSVEDYIKSLDIKLKAAVNDKSAVDRLSQMALKTNQFNLTTRRYTEKDIENFMQKGWVFSAYVSDKFGDYGITVLAIVEPLENKAARLDSFLMSCRVMGRGVEQSFFRHIVSQLEAKGLETLLACFISTAKNEPARNFLPSLGFSLIGEKDGQKDYSFTLAKKDPLTYNTINSYA